MEDLMNVETVDPGMSVVPSDPGMPDIPTVIPELDEMVSALQSDVSFAKKTWKDGSGGGTPITAAELNRLETGVADLTAAVNALRDSVSRSLIDRGYLKSGDLNDYKSSGIYSITPSTESSVNNMPRGVYRFGVLMVVPCDEFCLQLFYPDNSQDGECYRVFYKTGNAWRSWRKNSASTL